MGCQMSAATSGGSTTPWVPRFMSTTAGRPFYRYWSSAAANASAGVLAAPLPRPAPGSSKRFLRSSSWRAAISGARAWASVSNSSAVAPWSRAAISGGSPTFAATSRRSTSRRSWSRSAVAASSASCCLWASDFWASSKALSRSAASAFAFARLSHLRASAFQSVVSGVWPVPSWAVSWLSEVLWFSVLESGMGGHLPCGMSPPAMRPSGVVAMGECAPMRARDKPRSRAAAGKLVGAEQAAQVRKRGRDVTGDHGGLVGPIPRGFLLAGLPPRIHRFGAAPTVIMERGTRGAGAMGSARRASADAFRRSLAGVVTPPGGEHHAPGARARPGDAAPSHGGSVAYRVGLDHVAAGVAHVPFQCPRQPAHQVLHIRVWGEDRLDGPADVPLDCVRLNVDVSRGREAPCGAVVVAQLVIEICSDGGLRTGPPLDDLRRQCDQLPRRSHWLIGVDRAHRGGDIGADEGRDRGVLTVKQQARRRRHSSPPPPQPVPERQRPLPSPPRLRRR